MRITFLGAAGTVTGSKHLVESGDARVLVDCGLFQGVKALRVRNRAKLPFDPSSLDAVLLTHAHIDHSGYLPVLVREGFEGPIYASSATADLCGILLPDAGHLQEEDAAYANRKGFSRHDPALPLYTEEDARRVLPLFRPLEPDGSVTVGGLRASATSAGHILGAESLLLEGEGGSALFSGDLGADDDPIIPAPDPPPAADAFVMESTYGGTGCTRTATGSRPWGGSSGGRWSAGAGSSSPPSRWGAPSSSSSASIGRSRAGSPRASPCSSTVRWPPTSPSSTSSTPTRTG